MKGQQQITEEYAPDIAVFSVRESRNLFLQFPNVLTEIAFVKSSMACKMLTNICF